MVTFSKNGKIAVSILSILLVFSLAAVGICTYLLVLSANQDYETALGFLEIVKENPEDVLYYAREADPGGNLLKDSLAAVRSRGVEEFDDTVAGIADGLMGADQVSFFTSNNRFGVENARMLGYLNGCLRAIGVDDVPYPEDDKGDPYDGSAEVPYDQEVTRVSGPE